MLRPLRDYVAFDFETTGLERDTDEIVEIGAVKISGGAPVERFTRLVKARKALSPLVSSLTGLTPEILAGARGAGGCPPGLPLLRGRAAPGRPQLRFRRGLPPGGPAPPGAAPGGEPHLRLPPAGPHGLAHLRQPPAGGSGARPSPSRRKAHRALPDAERSALVWNLAQEKLAGYSPATSGPWPACWPLPSALRDLFDSAREKRRPRCGRIRGATAAATAPPSRSRAESAGSAPAGSAAQEQRPGRRQKRRIPIRPRAPCPGPSRPRDGAGQPRARQGRLASLADRALREDCFLAVESDPGTGRTLACLAAAARQAEARRRTVYFARGRPPPVESHRNPSFPCSGPCWARPPSRPLKAPSSYLSPRKYADILRPRIPASRSGAAGLPSPVTWRESARATHCENMGFNHERQKACLVQAGRRFLRRRARKLRPCGPGERGARPPGAGHPRFLILDDLAVDFALLPPYEAVVFDDAHRPSRGRAGTAGTRDRLLPAAARPAAPRPFQERGPRPAGRPGPRGRSNSREVPAPDAAFASSEVAAGSAGRDGSRRRITYPEAARPARTDARRRRAQDRPDLRERPSSPRSSCRSSSTRLASMPRSGARTARAASVTATGW